MENKGSKMTILIVAAILLIGGGIFLATSSNDSGTMENVSTSQNKDTSATEKMDTMNIVETAMSDPQFSTLVEAVKAAGLVETLSGEGPFTVFAPTNAAFEKLPAGTLEALLQDPEKLKAILTYHVVSGNVKAADVVKLTSAKTVAGQDVAIKVNGSSVMVNDANVTKTDITTSNGTIHVIDTVLLPPAN